MWWPFPREWPFTAVLFISGDYLSFQGDSKKDRLEAMVTSPWQTRTSHSPLHCFKFRYLLYGSAAHHLEIFHKYSGKEESRIWTASQDDTDVWRYGQVPVGAFDEFQVDRSKRKRKQFLGNGNWQIDPSVTCLGTAWARLPVNQDDLTDWCLRPKDNSFLLKVNSDNFVKHSLGRHPRSSPSRSIMACAVAM